MAERSHEPGCSAVPRFGHVAAQAGKAAEALELLKQAVRFSPRNALAHQQLGLAFEALQRFDEAVSSLERAAALAPGAEQPHFFLGRIFRQLGRPKDAATQYATVARLLGAHSDTTTPNTDAPTDDLPQRP